MTFATISTFCIVWTQDSELEKYLYSMKYVIETLMNLYEDMTRKQKMVF